MVSDVKESAASHPWSIIRSVGVGSSDQRRALGKTKNRIHIIRRSGMKESAASHPWSRIFGGESGSVNHNTRGKVT